MPTEEVQGKIDFVEANLAKLARIPQGSYDEFMSDFRNLDSALYGLQTAIQGLMDLGSHLCASLGLPAPSTSRDVLEALEAGGQLPAGSADRFGPMFSFRNRVVHLYDRVDPKIVFRILTEDRRDLKELLLLFVSKLDAATP